MRIYTQTKEQAVKSAVRINKGVAIHSKIVNGLTFVAYYDERREKHGLICFYGKSGNPRFHYVFKSELNRENYALETVKTYLARQERENERRAKAQSVKAADFYSVGDVAYSSWGYEQTNIDWYQIIAIKPKSVVVRKIAENCSDRGGPNGGYTFPRRNEFIGEPEIKRVDVRGNICNGRYTLYKWDGRKKHCSSYH